MIAPAATHLKASAPVRRWTRRVPDTALFSLLGRTADSPSAAATPSMAPASDSSPSAGVCRFGATLMRAAHHSAAIPCGTRPRNDRFGERSCRESPDAEPPCASTAAHDSMFQITFSEADIITVARAGQSFGDAVVEVAATDVGPVAAGRSASSVGCRTRGSSTSSALFAAARRSGSATYGPRP